jgi:L-seryl-tRNA(Ser) seleniumtransferase
METNERLSAIPQVERLLADPDVAAFFPLLSRPLATRVVTLSLAAERERALADGDYAVDASVCRAAAIRALEVLDRKRLRKTLNGTGIVLNTNLGRSPVSESAWIGAHDANTGYAPLELDLDSGKRGRRGGLCHDLAAMLAGAEAALVVNNNAAGVLLALTAIAKDKEVVIARGEQVQIGGGFRVPDILELAGARFVEVGTTNIVTENDYRRAIHTETSCVLLVHTSNFALRGFSSKPGPAAVVAALPASIPVIVDQGSGCAFERIPGERQVGDYIDAGCTLVCFSADKLLGGPQAGIVAGRADLVARLARHPLYRAFRPGKMVYSLLERVLVERLNGEAGPAGRAIAMPVEELKKTARKIRSKLPKGVATLVDTRAASGGGSGPDEFFDSIGLSITSPSSAAMLQAALRKAPVPLVAMIRNGAVLVDMATLAGEDPMDVVATISWALERSVSLRASAERYTERNAEHHAELPGDGPGPAGATQGSA